MRSAGYDWADTLFYSAGAGVCAFCTAYSFGMSAYGLYCAYSAYQGVAPVTQIGTSSANSTSKSPYSNLVDPPNVAPGKDFTAKQKNQIIEQNKINNNGVVRSDLSGIALQQPQKSAKGITPSPFEWQIDHIQPKSSGGTNSFSNAQVLSREENRIKWDNWG